jgi:Domain of unknown function (DUF6457)
VTVDEWVAAFAAAAGVTPPTPDEVATLLDLAGVAAHASERTAAPITCWLAATGGLSPVAALDLATSLSVGA